MYFLFKVSASFLIFNSCDCLLYCSPWRLVILGLSYLLFLGYLTPSCECFLNYYKEGKKHLSKCFLFLRRDGVGGIEAGVGILGNSLFFFLMCW